MHFLLCQRWKRRLYKVCLNTKNDSHDSEKANKTDAGNACHGHDQSQGDVNKHEINDGNNDV